MALTVQFYTILSMAAMGLWLGAAIDTYGRFRLRRHSFDIKTTLLDILFWVIQACIVFFILFKSNLGEVRIYVFLALLCGYAGYQALFKGLYNQLLEAFIKLLQAIFRVLVWLVKVLVYYPIKWILHFLRRLAMMIVIAIWSVVYYLLLKPSYSILSLLGVIPLLKKGQPVVLKIKELYRRLVKKE